MMTTVEEDRFRPIAQALVDQKAAPTWFADIEYINWPKPFKDLQKISGADLHTTCLLDDYHGYVHPNQKKNWIEIQTFWENKDKDKELLRIMKELSKSLKL